MYARLLIESLRRGTRRKLLAVSAVALGTLGATALGEVVLASGDRLAAEMGSYGANLVTAPAQEGKTLPVEDLVKVRRIFWKNNIVAVAPTLDLRAAGRLLVRPPAGAGVPHRPAAHPADPGRRGALAS
jgi:putative ABC transport system permease protein